MKPYSWILCFVALLASSTTTLYAQPAPEDKKPERAPWEWTLEERIAARYDLERVKVRMAVRNQVLRARGWTEDADREAQAPANFQIISARDNPELFLPTELFRAFLFATFDHDRERRLLSRRAYSSRTRLELDEDFWRDISVIASNLLANQHRLDILWAEIEATPPREKDRLKERTEPERKRLSAGFCQELRQVLDEVRALYGPVVFDKFLYKTIQPGRVLGEMVEPETAGLVQRRERGCKDAS